MRTYKGQFIKQSYIRDVIKSMDATKIFRLYHILYGEKPERSKVKEFIEKFAMTRKVYNAAYMIAYGKPKEEARQMVIYSLQFKKDNAKHLAIECLRENIARGLDNYTKRPIMGHTHLYFASPVYLHGDYNKWRSVEIKGNERFCETICRLADKYFPIVS